MKYLKAIAFAMVLTISASAYTANAQEKPAVMPIKAKIEDRIEKNKEIRNDRLIEKKGIMEERKDIRDEKKDIRDERKENIKDIRDDIKDARKDMKGEIKDMREERKEMRKDGATTTPNQMFKAKMNEKRDMVKKMKVSIFDERKSALIKELKLSVENLTNISGRISERISKLEADGKDVTEAKAAFEKAKNNLEAAKTGISVFENINIVIPDKTTTGTDASNTEVDLEKPRTLGDVAIKSVKEARDSLKKVVEIINKIK